METGNGEGNSVIDNVWHSTKDCEDGGLGFLGEGSKEVELR